MATRFEGTAEGKSDQEDCEEPPAKRTCAEDRRTCAEEREVLPLPSAILEMFPEEEDEPSSTHEGRTRSFPHVHGNWASYVHIPFHLPSEVESKLTDFTQYLNATISAEQRTKTETSFKLCNLDNLHVSLSRTVAIRHHWIEPLTKTLRDSVKRHTTFEVSLCDLEFYCNDEKTRTFLGLEITQGHNQLCALVRDIDQCFALYNLPQFYEDPSFHISLLWCLGDFIPQVNDQLLERLQAQWASLVCTASGIVCTASEVQFKTGNKVFSLALS